MHLFPDVVAPLAVGAVLFASILCAQAPASGQAPGKPRDPAVEALLTKLAATRGVAAAGKDVALAASGRYVVTFEGVGEVAKGPLRESFAGTTMARCTSEMGEYGAMEKGQHGDTVWEIDPSMGARVLRGSSAAAARRYFAVLRGDDPRTLYRQIEKTGVQQLDGREVSVLRMTPEEGEVDTWYVAADGTLARFDTALPAPESADAAFDMKDLMPAQLTFADWQAQGTARYPRTRVLTMGKAKVTSTWETVTVGTPIDAAKFALPEKVAKVKNAPLQPATDAAGKPTWQVTERAAQPVASIRVKVKVSEISKQLAILLPEVGKHLNAVGAMPAGAPFTRYHTDDGVDVEIEAGIPVQKPFAESDKNRVKNSELPGGKVVTGWHVGPYDKLPGAHAALAAHLAAQQLKARGGVFEIYWTDPGMVPDPSKWRTQLFAPIE